MATLTIPIAVTVLALMIMVRGVVVGMRDKTPVHIEPPMGG